MRQNSLAKVGLSLSQAQSISNLCYQKAQEIDASLKKVNNCSKSVEIDRTEWIIVSGNPLPDNVVELLQTKASLHACQAFLVENIKAKDALIKQVQEERCSIPEDLVPPERFSAVSPAITIPVKEEWGWEQLTAAELAEFYEAEAYAAHIGQFIHKDGVLHTLRKTLPTIPSIEWLDIETTKKTPVKVDIHHTPEQLFEIHEELAALHRDYEAKVNYFKAKVKNLVTLENARIAELNATAGMEAKNINIQKELEWSKAYLAYGDKVRELNAAFEITRQGKIQDIVKYRIQVPSRFQAIIDSFLTKVPDES